MTVLDKIIANAKTPKPLGPADLAHKKLQEKFAKQNQERDDRARLAALEPGLAADDQLHANELRAAFIRREKPTATALGVFDANQKVELQKKVIARTSPRPVQLNDGTFGAHPAVTKLTLAKAALAQAIKMHEHAAAMARIDFGSLNEAYGQKGTK